ncbi:50S ribosomal protein L28 [Borrelia hermsii]|uniref:Large ribosomal subunit protein bL28 n=3 Tax=Borrelia hermsii TaxID=140 RepID=RL28_BORHD|nr:50S ribosomal protein L28 [Borrelia hermsii]B2S057.1 RecName: Full=Large ribosomal subunit protein bL28; AltName: Full=50S ribosomal protein L28 [Borrelia hermsii DAH]AAX16863.1 LSU ribosomal protein L28P [Borrelia hermsii DAH]AJW73162.1 50S ribosomal protein L28 [Borrelia hermsii CC1]AMR75486.1 50S ribosomal protein L28 [Borrelia hermsii]ANA43162.1 50S ribosomal protein L28 [Borrelia hermsii HS1]UCP01369.1 50S ribosomal protein L28 [Borrelia hermsii]
MGRECEITGKRTMFGNNVPRKGLAKKKGGAGQHIGVKTKRTFKVNLINKKFFIPELGKSVNIKISASALRSISKVGLSVFLKKNCKKIEDFI